jgi:polar amino acid transport system substrate-binding protein
MAHGIPVWFFQLWLPALAVALLSGSPLMADDSLRRVQERGTLRWGADVQGGEPYAFQDPRNADRVIGFEVEIAAALARHLGVRAELVQNDWSTLIASLERGDFDVALNGIEITAARRERLAFTRPYYRFSETLVVRRADAPQVHGLEDLPGRRVGTLASSLAHEILRDHGDVEVVLYEGVEEPFIDLEHGRTAAVLLDHIIAERYGLVRPTLAQAAVAGDGVYAVALRREDSALRAALDDALDAMRRDGELRVILERWRLWNDQQEQPFTLPESRAIPLGMSAAQIVLFLRGAAMTLLISALAMILAVSGGLTLALARQYAGASAQAAARAYVELFRGTPVLLQLYVLYYGLAPVLALDAFTAAVLGLGLNYAAYEAELYRAGFGAVPHGQTEAALALGMSRRLAVRRIVLPQALRVALPGITNDFIALLKDSSLVSVITVVELTKQMTITAVDVRGWLLPGALCAGLYLAMSLPLSRLARRLERRLLPGSV